MKFDVNQSVESRLRFEPNKKYDNFCIGKLDSVEFEMVKIDDDKEWEFKGMEVPRIAFHFVNYREGDEPERFFSHSNLPPARVKKNGEASEESKYQISVTRLWGQLIHLYNAYKSSPNFRPLKQEDFPEFDEKADSSPEKRIAEFKQLFEVIYKYFKGDETKGEKPVWLGADGNSIIMTMKLIATDGKNSQYLDFPQFVGEGFIQPFATKDGKLVTTLRFRSSESVILKATEAPRPAAPGTADDSDLPASVRDAIRG